ncbi:Hypothetical predicted protein, partial [Paramuricea clavata]
GLIGKPGSYYKSNRSTFLWDTRAGVNTNQYNNVPVHSGECLGLLLHHNNLPEFARQISHRRNTLNIAHINIRNLRHKVDEVRLLLQICHLEILAITETHLDSKISNQQLEVENYKIFRRDREGKQGGGCLIYLMNNICAIRLRSLEATEIEQIWLRINSTTFFENFDRNLEKVWL